MKMVISGWNVQSYHCLKGVFILHRNNHLRSNHIFQRCQCYDLRAKIFRRNFARVLEVDKILLHESINETHQRNVFTFGLSGKMAERS